MYTNDSNVNQRLPTSPLLDWCRKNGAEMLAVQLPGRANRLREVNFFLFFFPRPMPPFCGWSGL